MSEETVRLSVPLTIAQRNAIKSKAAQVGLSQAEVVRRFLFAWVEDEIELPDESQGDATLQSIKHGSPKPHAIWQDSAEWTLSAEKLCPECEGEE